MKALAVVGCIFGAAGFLLAAHSAVSPSKAPRTQPIIEPGRVLPIQDADEVQHEKGGGCCKPKEAAPKKPDGCQSGCDH